MRSKGLFAFVLVVTFALALAGQGFGAIIRVKWDSPTNGPGSDWDNAYHTVAAGIAAAVSSDEVWVARGVYVERITVKSGVAVYGGFAGDETSRDQRNWVTNATILDGGKAGTVVTCGSSLLTRIDGFTIRNGTTGVSCSGSSGTVANNTIANNAAASYGGGIYGSSSCSATICNNLIVANNAATYGGGIYITSGSPKIVNNTIVGNFAQNGGGLYISTSATISNNIVAFNSSGLYKNSGTPVLSNNCFYNPDGYNYSGISAGTGDIQVDPQLVAAGYGDPHVQTGSPCIDAGSDATVLAGWTDIDGQARIQGAHVDIGADECDGVTRTFTPAVVRVSAAGNDANDGSTWALAKRTVQAGINAASQTGGEVWVAAGTYAERITLTNLVFVCGGFAGTESAKSNRDWNANVAILDGGAAGSVVTAQKLGHKTCAIDGLTIRNGKASNGGGISCSYSDLIIANNNVCNNVSTSTGGGLYCYYSSPIISNNLFTGNTATGGGAIYCYDTYSSPSITGNTVAANTSTAATGCGAIELGGGAPVSVTGNCVIGNTGYGIGCGSGMVVSGNVVSTNTAGGIYCKNGSPAVTDNLIGGNRGVGVYCDNTQAVVSRNTIIGNADRGAYCSSGTPKVLSNVIASNGCGVHCASSAAVIANNVISGNTQTIIDGTAYSGGIYCYGSSPLICNNTITANSGSVGGGAIYCSTCSPVVSNNIMAFNKYGVEFSGSGTPVLRNNCVYNPDGADYTGVSPGTGDIQLDPRLVAAEHGQVHIQPGSPCIDAGCDTDVQLGWTDMDGQTRIQAAHVDIGADESDTTTWTYAPPIIRVSPTGNDANDGSTWALAKRTVQGGTFAASLLGGEVWVAAGVYAERITLPSCAYLYGGFAGTETARSQRDYNKNLSIVDGGAGGIVVQVMASDNCTASGIDGFTIQNGKGAGIGGISASSGSPTIANNTITGNVGTGLRCGEASLVTGNTITGNTATLFPYAQSTSGGGLVAIGSPTISGNIIASNTADSGGGIACSGSAAIYGNIIKSNTASYGSGGGIYLTHGPFPPYPVPVLTGNLITGNITAVRGGGVFCLTTAIVTNNTIAGNSAPTYGGGICASEGTFSNNIVALNSTGFNLYNQGYQPTLHNNCIYNPAGYNYSGLSAGVGDISVDPIFVNAAGGDYHLKASSPCIDAGWSSATGIPALDMDGEVRLNGIVDIGADEYWLGPVRCVSDAKTAIDTSPVSIYGGIVSAVFGEQFYVESDDRVSGVLVKREGHTLHKGDRARVLGAMATNLDSERFIDASTADSTGTGSVGPLGMPNKSIGGGTCGLQSGVWGWLYTTDQFGHPVRLWDQAAGLNNIGLLISTCGKVTGIEHPDPPALPSWFTIDDGSGINLKCIVPSGVTIEPGWEYVRVTGVASCEKVGSELHAVVKVRSREDITAL